MIDASVSGGEVTVDRDWVFEGQDVQIEYHGDGPLVMSVDGGPWQTVTVDSRGRATVTAPIGSTVLVFSDRGGASVGVEVFSSGRGR